jgi:hypothetical protein
MIEKIKRALKIIAAISLPIMLTSFALVTALIWLTEMRTIDYGSTAWWIGIVTVSTFSISASTLFGSTMSWCILKIVEGLHEIMHGKPNNEQINGPDNEPPSIVQP